MGPLYLKTTTTRREEKRKKEMEKKGRGRIFYRPDRARKISK